MVPAAARASLHDIRGVFMTCALQLVDIAGLSDALAVLWQSMPKHVGHEDHIHFFANRTDRLRWFTDVASSANEFWMGITYRVFADTAFLHFVDQGAPCESMVDNADITSQHVDRETHTATR